MLVLMIWFGAMYWKPARPPMVAVSIEILTKKIKKKISFFIPYSADGSNS
jgi:hypothetical protein